MEQEFMDMLMFLVPYLITFGIGSFAAYYGIFKGRFHQFVVVMKTIDDALYDDKITEEEFRAIFEAVKKLIAPEVPAKPKK